MFQISKVKNEKCFGNIYDWIVYFCAFKNRVSLEISIETSIIMSGYVADILKD